MPETAVSKTVVDLRSDTVTRPTPAMRAAMAAAEVGDDGYGEDPTVRRLEATYAEMVGKEAALFVPSGVMANQIALRVHAAPGDVVLTGRRQHVVLYEDGAAARNSGLNLHGLDDDDGTVATGEVQWMIDAGAHHQPQPVLLAIENTHMPSGGRPWPQAHLDEICGLGLPVHVDGARLFNAQVATGVPVARIVESATTVMSCLSKGLAAPVGSLLAGPAELMVTARRERKRLGGAMRQAGVIAAAGLVALDTMIDRLADDHRRARRLAVAVHERWPETRVDPHHLPTNVVVFAHRDTTALIGHLRSCQVLAGSIAPGVMRLMTHLDVDDFGLERAVDAISTAP